mmetsp:Transcript_38654/g.90314  ORF Transcript_38654/g.90314 Transcript_38654/m.90314 type:complete len:209 (+) Transcript_38654:1-627(+)
MAQWAVFLFALATSAAQKIHFNAGGPALETADRNFLPLACGEGAWSESARHPLVGPRNVPLEAYTTRCVGNKLSFSIPLPESLRGRPLRVTVKSSDSGFQPATWLWETFKQARHWEQSVVSVHIRGEKSSSHHGAPLKAGEIQSLFRVRVPPTNAEFVDLEIESKGAPAFVNSIQVQLSDSHDAFSWSHDTQIRSAPSASSIFRKELV